MEPSQAPSSPRRDSASRTVRVPPRLVGPTCDCTLPWGKVRAGLRPPWEGLLPPRPGCPYSVSGFLILSLSTRKLPLPPSLHPSASPRPVTQPHTGCLECPPPAHPRQPLVQLCLVFCLKRAVTPLGSPPLCLNWGEPPQSASCLQGHLPQASPAQVHSRNV